MEAIMTGPLQEQDGAYSIRRLLALIFGASIPPVVTIGVVWQSMIAVWGALVLLIGVLVLLGYTTMADIKAIVGKVRGKDE